MKTVLRTRITVKVLLGIGVALIALGAGRIAFPRAAIAGGFFNPFLPLQVSTIPANGDANPYGLAFVPYGFPSYAAVKPGQLLVSNFNDTATQGLGTTIVSIDPSSGSTALFFQGTSPIGFTNALTIARAGLVFGGSLPTSSGTPLPGPLLVLDRNGNLLTQLGSSDLVNGLGAWRSTIVELPRNYLSRIYLMVRATSPVRLPGLTSSCRQARSRFQRPPQSLAGIPPTRMLPE
jgi:hypothetical protein